MTLREQAPPFLLRFLQWFREGAYSFRTLVRSYGELLPEFESLGPVDCFEPMGVRVNDSSLGGDTNRLPKCAVIGEVSK